MLSPRVSPQQGSCSGTRMSSDLVVHPVCQAVIEEVQSPRVSSADASNAYHVRTGVRNGLGTWCGWWQLWHFLKPRAKAACWLRKTVLLGLGFSRSLFNPEAEA